MKSLLNEITNCTICADHLPHGCRPVLTAHPDSKLIIIGQAPGRKVHESGIPWDDKSGDNLREWLGVSKELFYDPTQIALVPMGFCYPGTGKSGDLPPRKECAATWHKTLLSQIENPKMTLLVGSYAQKYYLGKSAKRNLTETVKAYKEYLPKYLPLVHPSPRNNIWQAKNEWFKKELVPELRDTVGDLF